MFQQTDNVCYCYHNCYQFITIKEKRERDRQGQRQTGRQRERDTVFAYRLWQVSQFCVFCAWQRQSKRWVLFPESHEAWFTLLVSSLQRDELETIAACNKLYDYWRAEIILIHVIVRCVQEEAPLASSLTSSGSSDSSACLAIYTGQYRHLLVSRGQAWLEAPSTSVHGIKQCSRPSPCSPTK